jgi:two-component system, NarL family, sensor histidine kinase UhpB
MNNRDKDRDFRALFDQSHDAVFLLDLNGRHLKANRRAAELLGYSEAEIQHLSYKDLSAEPVQSRERINRLLQGERLPLYERTFRRKDSTPIPVEINVELVRDAEGHPHHIQSIVRDISARKQAEAEREAALEALRESEERFKLAMEATQDGLWDWNVPTNEIYRSPGYAKMLGYDPDTFFSTLGSWLDQIHPEDREAVIAANQACVAGRQEGFEIEFRMRAKDGNWRWILGRAKAVSHDADGRATRVVGTHTDITERKRAEAQREAVFEALQESQRWLEEIARRVLQTQELERRALAQELHEEIAQAMLAVKLNLQFMKDENLAQRSVDAIRTSLVALDDAIQRMQHLSRDLRPAVLDDLGLVPALRALLDRQAQQASFRASFSADSLDYQLPSTLENAYFRIAQEAVTNAARHADAAHVAVELRDEDGTLLLVVRDDGTGFDAKARLNGGNAEESLGLISMRERAHLVGGTVEIASQPGHGTEVRVRTPVPPEA